MSDLMTRHQAHLAERERRVALREAQVGHKEHNTGHGRFGNLTAGNLEPDTQYDADWFTYLFNIGTVAGAATVTPTPVTIQSDSAFEVMQINAQGNITAAVEPFVDNIILPFLITLQDSGTGRVLMNSGVPINMISGRGTLPFILPQERIFKPKATISLTVTNYGASSYSNNFLALIGRKLFDYRN